MDIYKILDILAKIIAVALVLSFHEFAHAYAAVKNGDITPKIYRRYTINPLAHFDILGLLMFVFVGFGWAKPVPINPSNFKNYKKGLFWTSVSGVLINFIFAFLLYPLSILAYRYLPNMLLYDDLIYSIIYYAFWFNLLFCVFNLLPLYPLDGFRLWEALDRRRGKIFLFFRNYGYYILLGLVALSYISSLINLPQLNILWYIMNFLTDVFGWPIYKFWGLII